MTATDDKLVFFIYLFFQVNGHNVVDTFIMDFCILFLLISRCVFISVVQHILPHSLNPCVVEMDTLHRTSSYTIYRIPNDRETAGWVLVFLSLVRKSQ